MSGCFQCHGEGFIVICVDDMCRGTGHCVHGDGEVICPNCLDDEFYGDDDDDADQPPLGAEDGGVAT